MARKWTEAEDFFLKSHAGENPEDLAPKLGISARSIKSRMAELGVTNKPDAPVATKPKRSKKNGEETVVTADMAKWRPSSEGEPVVPGRVAKCFPDED